MIKLLETYRAVVDAIGFVLCGIVIVWIVGKVRSWIFKKGAKKLLNATIGNKFDAKGNEVFQGKKLADGFFNIKDKVKWSKDFTSIFNLRKLCMFAAIAGLIFGAGQWHQLQQTPIQFSNKHLQESEWALEIPANTKRIYHEKDSPNLYFIDKDGNKTLVKIKDVEALRKALKPFGVIFEPYAIAGIGVGGKGGAFEAGAGLYWLKYYKWKLGNHLTNKGIYMGVSYSLNGINLDNTALNFSYGMGYDGEQRVLIGATINF